MQLHELYPDIVKEHSLSRHNRRRLERADIAVPGKNPSCGDEIELELCCRDGRIADAAYTGTGCAVSQASVSMMIDLVRGRTVEEAHELSRLFLDMAQRKELSSEDLQRLEDAAALKNISNMPARVKCATMPWHTLLSALETQTQHPEKEQINPQ